MMKSLVWNEGWAGGVYGYTHRRTIRRTPTDRQLCAGLQVWSSDSSLSSLKEKKLTLKKIYLLSMYSADFWLYRLENIWLGLEFHSYLCQLHWKLRRHYKHNLNFVVAECTIFDRQFPIFMQTLLRVSTHPAIRQSVRSCRRGNCVWINFKTRLRDWKS